MRVGTKRLKFGAEIALGLLTPIALPPTRYFTTQLVVKIPGLAQKMLTGEGNTNRRSSIEALLK
ncbi:hypothetical protein [Oxynema aestuarii]|uniref:Uncharacterized protein n=1 Tax=Oxynema aestuarii AP17 TaxID=2064643 RepID=A0A6H1U741_9CYAN|nr:hypothetical protein [Oxynema aestuarii]QIZ73449.1 hypothetical protein HCG48_24955 [Oxynema aestuarii AP17]RMH74604.1 MAG: hypothetical protein D6680_14235 [Cyanobacteria bacterium J007]